MKSAPTGKTSTPAHAGYVGQRVGQALTTGTYFFLGVKLGVLLLNILTFPRLRAAPYRSTTARATTQAAGARRVSLLVPARDEAHNLRRHLPGLLAQGAGEVLVLDDGSQDDTARIAAELGARVIQGAPLPPDWYGKPWACQQLGQAASGELLVFTDADVTWQAGALAALLHEHERRDADLLSIFPRQENVTLGERLLTPLVDDVLLTLFPVPLLHLPFPSASAANGQVMVFKRSFYEQLGGHAPVQNEMLEDIALARRTKEQGGRVALALGRHFIGVRMYTSYPASVRGFAKNALPMHGGNRLWLALSGVSHLLVYTLPLLRRERRLLGLALLEGLLVRWLSGRRRQAELAEAALMPALPLLAAPVFWRAWRDQVEWRGRHYVQQTGNGRKGKNRSGQVGQSDDKGWAAYFLCTRTVRFAGSATTSALRRWLG